MLFKGTMGTDYSGSLAGITASRNRGGAYLRNRSIPTNTNTTRQQDVRAAFAFATLQWRLLTDVQRAAWNAYAAATPITNRIGETITLAGNSMYIRQAAFLLGLGQLPLSDAPTEPGLSTLGVAPAITASEATGVTMATSSATVGSLALVQYSPPKSAGVTYIGGPYSRFGSGSQIATGFTATQSPTPGRYGPILQGEIRAFRICSMDTTGRLSNGIEQLVTVAA